MRLLVMANRPEMIEDLSPQLRCRAVEFQHRPLRSCPGADLRSTVLVYASSLSGPRMYQFVEVEQSSMLHRMYLQVAAGCSSGPANGTPARRAAGRMWTRLTPGSSLCRAVILITLPTTYLYFLSALLTCFYSN